MRPRTAGRRLAFQYLFMADLLDHDGVETPERFLRIQREAVRDAAGGGAEPGGFGFDGPDPRRDEAEGFALRLIAAALGRREEIDAAIAGAVRNWSVARMGAVERNVIRLAAAEMAEGCTPAEVVMDEAVELAKRFGDEGSGAFVNGVVDRLGSGRGAAEE